ncbi:MAG: lysophospholipid acyltransferase family protein [Pseudomonadales bacterium]
MAKTNEASIGPYGTSELKRHIKSALAITRPQGRFQKNLYRYIEWIFNPQLIDVQNLPDKPCLFVGNHSLFALDGMILGPAMLAETGRFLRPMGDRFLWNTVTENFILSQGGVIGDPEVCSALMKDGRDLLVYPGGAHEATKTQEQRYTLQWKQRCGFVKLAAEHGYSIMPVAMVGPDEFYDHRIEGEDLLNTPFARLAQAFGLLDSNIRPDIIPPIPSGLFGSFLPKPQQCFIQFGKPVDLSRYKGKELSRRQLQNVRNKVSTQLEVMLEELLIAREEKWGIEKLIRSAFTR